LEKPLAACDGLQRGQGTPEQVLGAQVLNRRTWDRCYDF
jgi:hypothetical protein